jgi:hypothetical protein
MFHEISFNDLEFERVPAVFYSTRSVPQFRSVQAGMPRIPENVINGVFYLYWSKEDALAGINPGGTGFIVRYQGASDRTGRIYDSGLGFHYYGVTNWHVACRGFSTIRVNTKDGGTDIIELDPAEWHFIPGKYDVAVVPLSLDANIHDVSSVGSGEFAQEEYPGSPVSIGVGDDVFMIGLFVDHGGTTTNVPSARFGNISMLPNPKATIKQPTEYLGESYVVDMHSRTGFSGSPVYVYRTFGSNLDRAGVRFDELRIDQFRNYRPGSGRSPFGERLSGHIVSQQMFQLLGIHWGQFPEKWELRDKSKLAESRRDLIVEGGYVEGMSGMTCVIPAWHIIEVLQLPVLQKLRRPEIDRAEQSRRAGMKKVEKIFSKEPKAESVEKSVPLANDANPNHREDFTRLLGEAARKPPQED